MKAAQNRYTRIIEKIFFKYYQEGATEIPFEREDITRVAKELKIRLPIEQDLAICANKFPALICRPIAAQFMSDDVIVLFKFGMSEKGIIVSSEKHYRLVPPEELSQDDLEKYRAHP